MLQKKRLSFRPKTPSDEAFLCTLFGNTLPEELTAALGQNPAMLKVFYEQQYAARRTNFKRYNQLEESLIIIDEQPIGVVVIDRQQTSVNVVDMAILPNFRGKGVGEYVLASIMDKAKANEQAVTLSVQLTNPALRLYKRLGFTEVDRDDVFARMIFKH